MIEHLGIEIGSLYSSIAYCQDHDNKVRVCRLPEEASPRLPTILHYEETCCSIGSRAIASARQHDDKITRRFLEHSAEDIGIYLTELVNSYQQLHGEALLGHISISVPEHWRVDLHHPIHRAVEHLKIRLNTASIHLVSSAQSYAHFFYTRLHPDFTGQLLIFDCGYESTRLYLCSHAEQGIVLREHSVCRATAAQILIQDIYDSLLPSDANESTQQQLYQCCEQLFYQQLFKVNKAWQRYQRNPALNPVILKYEEITLRIATFISFFQQKINPELDAFFRRFFSASSTELLGDKNAEQVQIICVGGLASFYPFEQAIRKELKATTSIDPRFYTHQDIEKSSEFSAVKGAALCAYTTYQQARTCPASIGLQFIRFDLSVEETVILAKGVPLEELHTPHYAATWLQILSQETLAKCHLLCFIDTGVHRRHFHITLPFMSLIPQHEITQQWRIGFSINQDLELVIHVEDTKQQHKMTVLGALDAYI